jgi:hypothetical protein
MSAVLSFSKAVRLLKACNGEGRNFAKKYHITEEARLHAENTHLMIDLIGPSTAAQRGWWTARRQAKRTSGVCRSLAFGWPKILF